VRAVARALAVALALPLLASCAAASGAGTSGAAADPMTTLGVTTWPAGSRPAVTDVSGITLGGQPLALSALRGHVVVLNAWASWCYPCRAEMPDLATVARATAGRGVTFLGINEQDDRSSAVSFVAAQHIPFTSLVDVDGRLLGGLKVVSPAAIPSTLVLDQHGLVAARIIGPATVSQLTAVLDRLAPTS